MIRVIAPYKQVLWHNIDLIGVIFEVFGEYFDHTHQNGSVSV